MSKTKNKLSDLRDHLFETLEALKDEEKPMDLARARVISDVAQTIINLAKVEIEFMEVMSAETGSEFFETPEEITVRIVTDPELRAAAAKCWEPREKGAWG